MTDKLSYTIAGAAEATELTEWSIREAIRRGDLVARYQGTKRVILRRELEEYLEALPDEKVA